ncbi:MAG: hypothetical protein ACYTF6_14170, partial [Planctomycetota bacterium]
EDEAILINGAAVGGHATVGRRAILSGHVMVHQFCWIGECVMTQGNAGFSTHLPPFTMGAGINKVIGLNTIGLRRNPEISAKDHEEIKQAFKLLYRSKLTPARAVEEMFAKPDLGAPARRFCEFIRRALEAKPPYNRGLSQVRARGRS